MSLLQCDDAWHVCRPDDAFYGAYACGTTTPAPAVMRAFARDAVVRGPDTEYLLPSLSYETTRVDVGIVPLAAHRVQCAAAPHQHAKLLRDACFCPKGSPKEVLCATAEEWEHRMDQAPRGAAEWEHRMDQAPRGAWTRLQLARAHAGTVCVICMTEYSDVMFSCGHLACAACVQKIRTCMLCRAPVRQLRCITDAAAGHGRAARAASAFETSFWGPKIAEMLRQAGRRRAQNLHFVVVSDFADVNATAAAALTLRGHRVKKIQGTSRKVMQALSQWATPQVVVATPKELAGVRVPCETLLAMHPLRCLTNDSRRCAYRQQRRDMLWALEAASLAHPRMTVRVLFARGTIDESFPLLGGESPP
jgi:hypothetical protein